MVPWGLAALTGCAGWPWQPAAPLKTATADQLVQLLREREGVIHTMKALFRAQIKGPGIPIAQRVEAALYYRRPDALRILGFNHVGSELFNFVLNRDLYVLHVQGTGPVRGRTAELNRIGSDDARRTFQLSLLAVSGAIGIASVGQEAETRLTEEEDRYRLDVLESMGDGLAGVKQPRRRLWFDRRTLQVVQEDRLTPDGQVDATMLCDDFRYIGRDPLVVSLPEPNEPARNWVRPFKITVQDGNGRGSLSLTFHEMIPNPELAPAELGGALQ